MKKHLTAKEYRRSVDAVHALIAVMARLGGFSVNKNTVKVTGRYSHLDHVRDVSELYKDSGKLVYAVAAGEQGRYSTILVYTNFLHETDDEQLVYGHKLIQTPTAIDHHYLPIHSHDHDRIARASEELCNLFTSEGCSSILLSKQVMQELKCRDMRLVRR